MKLTVTEPTAPPQFVITMEKITSRKNPYIKHLRALETDGAYRREKREFVCDGQKTLAEALRFGGEVTSVLWRGAAAPGYEELPGQYCAPDELFDYASPLVRSPGPVFTVGMVIKTGRFGRFLACPNYPTCTFTKPLVIEMPGKCPKCGSRILKRTSKKGYTFYACERGAECGFMTWEVPTAELCPTCGKTMFKHSGKGKRKAFCINEACPDFLPEDKRGYHKKPAASAEGESASAAGTKPAAKKPAAKKTTAKKPAAKKPAAGKTTAKKPAAKKPAAKKTTAKKPAEKE